MEFWKTYVQGPLLINEVPIVKKLPLMSQKTISKKLVPSSSSYHQHRIREISPGMNSPMIIKELKPGSIVLVSSSKSGKNTPYLGKSISSTLSNEKFIEIPSIFYQTNNMPSSSGSVVSSSGVYTTNWRGSGGLPQLPAMSEGGGTTNLAPSEEPVSAEELAAPEELAASEGLAAPEGIHLSTQLRYEILLGHDGFDLCKCAI